MEAKPDILPGPGAKEKPPGFRPRMVLAHSDPAYAASVCRYFRRLGWEVHVAGAGGEVRRLTQALHPEVVVLSTDLGEESGWLICAKLTREYPGRKVFLVGSETASETHRFTTFVGAATLIRQDAGVQALIDEIQIRALPAAG